MHACMHGCKVYGTHFQHVPALINYNVHESAILQNCSLLGIWTGIFRQWGHDPCNYISQ